MIFESFSLNLLVALALIIALTFDYVTKFFSYWYVRHVPYKTPVPFFGSDYHRVLGLRNNTDEIKKLYNSYTEEEMVGSIKSRIPDLIVKDAELIKKVLSTEFESFQSRGLDLNKSRDVCIKNNAFYADSEKWTLLRQGLESVVNEVNFAKETSDYLTGINGDANVQEVLSNVLDVVFENILLGYGDTSVVRDIRKTLCKRTISNKVSSYLKNIFPSIYTLLGLSSLPDEPTKKTLKALQQSKVIRKAESMVQYDVRDKNKNSKNKPEEYAFGIFSTFLTEGYIPCLTVLTSLLYELAKNTHIQTKARHSEEYLNAAIKECMRKYPPYSVITRKCVRGYKFPEIKEDKCFIDKGVTVNIPVEAIHNDSTHYNESNMFIPERFTDSIGESYKYLPFGAGPRKCVGEQLALQIIHSVTRSILKAYEIQLSSRTPSKLPLRDHNFSRIIDGDIWLTFNPLSS